MNSHSKLNYMYMINRTFLPYQDKGRKSKKSPKATPEKDKRKLKKDKQSYSETNPEEESFKNSDNPRSKSPDKLKDGEWTMVLFDDYLKLKSTIEFQRSKIAELTSR